MSTLLHLEGVTHDYGDGPVLHGVDLAVAGGSVHALLGMNGAGKSTLVHIGAGSVSPSAGTILVDGTPTRFSSPADAIGQGVVLLAQEVDRALVADATVHENLTTARRRREGARGFSPRRNRRLAREILEHYGVPLDLDAPVSRLTLAERQLLTLVRAADSDARVLFLDEPTSALDAAETERFHGIVRALRDQGLGLVFISHRLGEVFEIADQVTVLRNGRVVEQGAVADTTPERLIEAITGGLAPAAPRRAANSPDVAFEARVPLSRDRGELDLHLTRGSVTAVFGPLGSGKTSLGAQLFGMREPLAARVAGHPVTLSSPVRARRAGIAYVPEERRAQGLWLEETVGTHLNVGALGVLHPRRERAAAATAIAEYAVEPADATRLVGRLSGGNQQKVAVGKWSSFGIPDLLILDEPMKGVDVAAREALFAAIASLAAQGTAVVYLTQEPDEALRVAHRIVLLARDRVVWDRPAHDLTLDQLLLPDPAAEPEETS